jgi:hypothetical protein
LRIAPDDSSMPLQTMSYWIAFRCSSVSLSFGSSARNFSGSMFGIENGLCEKVDLLLFLAPLEHREVDESSRTRSDPLSIRFSS